MSLDGDILSPCSVRVLRKVGVSISSKRFQYRAPVLVLTNHLLSFAGQKVVGLWVLCSNVFTQGSARASLRCPPQSPDPACRHASVCPPTE